MDPIIAYLQQDDLPNDPKLTLEVKWKLDGDQLVKRYSHPLLKCLHLNEVKCVLQKIHEGICGNKYCEN